MLNSSFTSSSLLPPIDRNLSNYNRGRKKKKKRKRQSNRKKFYKKIKSLPEDKCICGKQSKDSIGSCGESSYCILMLCKVKANIKTKRRIRKQLIYEDSLPNVFETNDSMKKLQKRDRHVKSLRKHFSTLKYEVIQPLNICTGVAREGAYCVSCKRVHYEPKHVWSTGQIVQDNIRKREKSYEIDKLRAIEKQKKLFIKSAKYLRRRRRRREKKLDLPANTLLKDYTDDGGGEIDADLQYAVFESLELRGTDPNKFNAKLGELFESKRSTN